MPSAHALSVPAPPALAAERVERAERASLALRALAAPSAAANGDAVESEAWRGAGRLVGEFADGQLAQLGDDVSEGLRLAAGRGTVAAAFAPDAPLGLGLGPLDPRGDGWGVEVGEIEVGGAAYAAGVRDGMVLLRMEGPDLDGISSMRFDEILAEIDERRAAGERLQLVFETAAPIERLYAVEMPATPTLAALALAEGVDPPSADAIDVAAAIERLLSAAAPEVANGVPLTADRLSSDDGDGGDESDANHDGRHFLWREPFPRLFIGDAGSCTCAHTDMVRRPSR